MQMKRKYREGSEEEAEHLADDGNSSMVSWTLLMVRIVSIFFCECGENSEYGEQFKFLTTNSSIWWVELCQEHFTSYSLRMVSCVSSYHLAYGEYGELTSVRRTLRMVLLTVFGEYGTMVFQVKL